MTELQHEKISNSGDTLLSPGPIKDISVKVGKEEQRNSDGFI